MTKEQYHDELTRNMDMHAARTRSIGVAAAGYLGIKEFNHENILYASHLSIEASLEAAYDEGWTARADEERRARSRAEVKATVEPLNDTLAAEAETYAMACPTCHGNRIAEVDATTDCGVLRATVPCPRCEGSGEIDPFEGIAPEATS